MLRIKTTGKILETLPLLGAIQQGETGAASVEIELPLVYGTIPLDQLDYVLYGLADGDVAATALLQKTAKNTCLLLHWQVSEEFTMQDAPLTLKLIGINAESKQIIKFSGRYPLFLRADSSVATPPSGMGAFQSALVSMEQLLKKNLAVSASPPCIGENGNWFLWDPQSEGYLDSGKSAKGPNGISPSIAVRKHTGEQYVLQVSGPDGTFETPNLIGGLKPSQADQLYANILKGAVSGTELHLTDSLPCPIDSLILGGKTTETLDNPSLKKSVLNPATLSGADNPVVFLNGKNLFSPAVPFPITSGAVSADWDPSSGELILNGAPGPEGQRVALGTLPFLWEPGQTYSLSVAQSGGSYTGAADSTSFVGAVVSDQPKGGFSVETGFNLSQSSRSSSLSMEYPSSTPQKNAIFALWIGSGVSALNGLRLQIQFEKGAPSSIRPIQPIQALSAEAPPLYSLPDGKRDEIDLISGRLIRRVKPILLNGSESWGLYEDKEGAAILHQSFKLSVPDCVGSASYQKSNLICSHLPLEDGDTLWAEDIPGVWLAEAFKLLILKVPKSSIPGWKDAIPKAERIQLFQQWLTAHPITLLAQLREETASSLPPLSAHSYSGETWIQTGLALPLSVQYCQDSNAVIQQLRNALLTRDA